MTKVHYTASPIVEALVEFQFDFDTAPDATLPGVFYSLLKDVYPERQQVMGWGVVPPGTEAGLDGPGLKMDPRTRFLSADGNEMVQVGGNILAVNVLTPYPGWTRFKPSIDRALRFYLEEFNPTRIGRVGLRYINHVEVATVGGDLCSSFELHPHIPTSTPIGRMLDNFVMKLESNPRDADSLRIVFGNDGVPQPANRARYLLDIDYASTRLRSETPVMDATLQLLEEAHDCILATFESCLTNQLKVELGRTEQ